MWPPKKDQPVQTDPQSHEIGERGSRLLSNLEVTIGRLTTTDADLREVVNSLRDQLAELRRLETDIRRREVEVRNLEADLEAKLRDHILVPVCDIVEVCEVAGEVSRKVRSIRDGL